MTLAVTVVRLALGLLFVVAGFVEVAGHEVAAQNFAHWDIPAPGVSIWLVGALEIVCGALFGLGILTRPVGLLLATVMVGAALTAGRIDGGGSLALPVIVFAACVFIAWRSDRVTGLAPRRQPGVQ